MTTIHAHDYSSTAQLIEAAIDRSVSHTEIVTIHCDDSADVAPLYAALFAECDGEDDLAHQSGVREYRGADLDGAEWRVHVLDAPRSRAIEYGADAARG